MFNESKYKDMNTELKTLLQQTNLLQSIRTKPYRKQSGGVLFVGGRCSKAVDGAVYWYC